MIFFTYGGRGGAAGGNYHFLFFFVPNVLNIISRHKHFFKYRGRGALWSFANIKCVAADIMRGAAIILYSTASILSNVPEILHVQHQFFEIFLSVLEFSKGKIHIFSKLLKNWSSCQKKLLENSQYLKCCCFQ